MAEFIASSAEDNESPSDLSPVVKEAMERWERCSTWESDARKKWLDDYKFANGDIWNGYQWPNKIRRARDIEERPSLTINKVRQHCLNIINDAKQNKPGIKVRAVGNGATVESADVVQGIARHIEYESRAQIAYDLATSFQVQAGLGYLRVGTEYQDDQSFDQVIRIHSVQNPLSIYVDPEAREPDKSDMDYAIIFDTVEEKEFKKLYPQYVKYMTTNALGGIGGAPKNHIWIAEYFRRTRKADTIYAVEMGEGQPPKVMRASELKDAPEFVEALKADPQVKSRETQIEEIEYYLIIGQKVIYENVWPGKYIPIVPVIGEETVIEGVLDRKGHTRAMIDPQRMYNYWASAAVEYGAIQTKTPWVAPAEAIEGYETYWENANKMNTAVLPYNALRDGGDQIIPPPQRVEPPTPLPVAITGMQIASQELLMVSGQYADQMGDKSNERSAKAISERQRQSDTSTYHYVDNLAIAIRQIGRIILDLIPKIYDTPRVMMILAEDGTSLEVEIDPKQQMVLQRRMAHDLKTIQRVLLNPNVGMYEVEADIGPNYGTKREEAFNALTLILTQAPQLTSVIGDILLRNSDFDQADEAAERLRRMVPPQALGDGPSVAETQLQQQVSQLTELLKKSMEELGQEKLRVSGKDARREVDVYKALTERLRVFVDAKLKAGQKKTTSSTDPEGGRKKTSESGNPDLDNMMDSAELKALVSQLVDEATGTGLEGVKAIVAQDLGTLASGGIGGAGPGGEEPPVKGARKGADGHWYVRNFAGGGPSYLLVE